MDAEVVVFLFVGATLLFSILALAKDSDGKRYGVKRMALLWCAALPYFLSSYCEFSVKHADNSSEKVKITYSTWFLLVMPFAMVRDNLARRKNAGLKPGATANAGESDAKSSSSE
jgi:hypothetical protein